MDDGCMTRDEARARGLKRYNPSKPCTRGHDAERYVGNNDCVVCSALRAAEYAKNNREAARLRATEWRNRNLERHRKYNRENYYKKQEIIKKRVKKWTEENRDRVKENQKRFYEQNAERVKQKAKEWAKQNRARRKEIMAANRMARKQARVPLSVADQDWMNFIYENCPEGYHVDHIYPINGKNSCGLHVPWNLQHLPAVENLKKSNREPGSEH